jgi:hypothetical protein
MTALRDELRRLFRWLKDRDSTTILTADRRDGARHGLEYVSDCVILPTGSGGSLYARMLHLSDFYVQDTPYTPFGSYRVQALKDETKIYNTKSRAASEAWTHC